MDAPADPGHQGMGGTAASHISTVVQTRSKAWATSKKSAETYFLDSNESWIILAILFTCSTVVCLCLKPNWWSGIRLLSVIIGCNLENRIFSKIFESTGRRLIGRYEEALSAALPGL
ncbi:unnamed protein product [Trichogramma brassicae]|uniref:Uncharacterized protein n=1 Tax=Trichogramma brassicae TaxID=86971 RepID=A0A6H5HW66_9HYME|nr:unnamed protein product [Trichogramma brassicae]